MKKEKVKPNKNIMLIAGIAASIVMIIIVLSFSLSSMAKSKSITGGIITGNSINLNEKSQSPEYCTKQEIDSIVEKRLQEIINNKTLRIELSGNANAYLCINSEGKIFRSEIPCK